MNPFTKLARAIKSKLNRRDRRQNDAPPDPLQRNELQGNLAQDNLVDPLAVAQQVGGLGGLGGEAGISGTPCTPWVSPKMGRPTGPGALGRHRAKARPQPRDVVPDLVDDTPNDEVVEEVIPQESSKTDYLIPNLNEYETDNVGDQKNDYLMENVGDDKEYQLDTNPLQESSKTDYLMENVEDEKEYEVETNPLLKPTTKTDYFTENTGDEKEYQLDTNPLQESSKTDYLMENAGDEKEYEVETNPLLKPTTKTDYFTENTGDEKEYQLDTNPLQQAPTKTDYFTENTGDEKEYHLESNPLQKESTRSDYLMENTGEEDDEVDTNPLQKVSSKTDYFSDNTGDEKEYEVEDQKQDTKSGSGGQKTDYLIDRFEEDESEGDTVVEQKVEGPKGPTPEEVAEKSPGRHQVGTAYGDKQRLAEMKHWDEIGKQLDEESGGTPTYVQAPPTPKKPSKWTIGGESKPQESFTKKPLLQSLDQEFVGEETGNSLADKNGHLANEIAGHRMLGTHYAKDSKEFGTQIRNGRLMQHGKVVNSSNNFDGKGNETAKGNTAIYVQKDKHERVNFALDGTGGLHTSDVRTETTRHLNKAKKTGMRHNHSSLVGGKDVAAAGTLKVREGKVEEIGDNSGHYKPSLSHMQQAVGHLQEQGAMDEQRSTVRLGKKGIGGDLLMSGTEFSGWKGEIDKSRQEFEKTGDKKALQRPEQLIRAQHQHKTNMLQDLRNTDIAIPNFQKPPVQGMTVLGNNFGHVLGNNVKPNLPRIDPTSFESVLNEPLIKPSQVKQVSKAQVLRRKEDEEKSRLAKQRLLDRKLEREREKLERQERLRKKKEEEQLNQNQN